MQTSDKSHFCLKRLKKLFVVLVSMKATILSMLIFCHSRRVAQKITFKISYPTSFAEIATSSSVVELKLAYSFVGVLFSLLGYVFVGLFVLLILDLETNATIESTLVTYFATT